MGTSGRDLFHFFDINGDGVISSGDLLKGLKQLGKFHDVPKVYIESVVVVVVV